jgi:cleavage stimulation factor subunit 3
MKFCRRAEGTKSARLVFKKAREDYRISYHVYIAAALMEYYCTKDTKIAGNVFELGFKKFKSDPRYVSEYLHFLSHLNEDNNTRVLFERSLTSDALKPDQAMQIWNKFLEFETNVGDLFGIKKVEKRRCLALDFSDKMMSFPTARLIDRYKYIDLYPCSSEELMSMGYESLEILSAAKVSTSFNGISKIEEIERSPSNPPIANMQPSKLDNIASTPVSAINKDGTPLKKIFKPDTSQMVPFKPKFKWITGEHRVSGGGFPLPVAASALCQMLPPPDCFQGPFVVVDRLMDVFMTMRLPDGHNASLSDKSFSVGNVDKSTILHTSNSDHYNGIPSLVLSNGQQEIESMVDINKNRSTRPVGTEASKRIRPSKHGRHDPRSDDEEETSTPTPTNDVYRQRQQKKLK